MTDTLLKAITDAIAIMRADCDGMIECGSTLMTDDAGSIIAIPGTLDPDFADDVERREAATRALVRARDKIRMEGDN